MIINNEANLKRHKLLLALGSRICKKAILSAFKTVGKYAPTKHTPNPHS